MKIVNKVPLLFMFIWVISMITPILKYIPSPTNYIMVIGLILGFINWVQMNHYSDKWYKRLMNQYKSEIELITTHSNNILELTRRFWKLESENKVLKNTVARLLVDKKKLEDRIKF